MKTITFTIASKKKKGEKTKIEARRHNDCTMKLGNIAKIK